jgi:predicted dehydrogenase
MDMGSHAIDLVSFLLGDASKVTAFTSSRNTGWEVEDTATLLIQMENGAHAITNTSFVVPHNGNMLELYGTKGTVLVGGGKVKTYIGNAVQEESMTGANFYKMQVEHFARYMAGEEEAVAPGIAGLKNIQIISAAYESARTGNTIPIASVSCNGSSTPQIP